ncbi:MAG: hypothetical protein CM15mP106_1090 [Candidatus Neomarinimicrobiota bacterium]|nr:MAG: hypothetical protein CM15mP106_1090 [Candidatus Neomarinimicrobiota bacterium]
MALILSYDYLKYKNALEIFGNVNNDLSKFYLVKFRILLKTFDKVLDFFVHNDFPLHTRGFKKKYSPTLFDQSTLEDFYSV